MQLKGDDLNDSDIMAYSAKDAGDDDKDDSIFSSGGAIMDALNGSDPSKEEIKKPKATAKGKAAAKKKAAPKKAAKVQTDNYDLG